jgi:hypothetical protein
LAILALPLAYANVGLALLAVGFDLTAFEDLAYGFRLVASRPGGIALIRWSMLADMLGFYLMLVPLALVLWDRLKEQNWQFMSLFTLSGLGYLFFGAMGAAILSVVAPSLITAYAQATAADSLVYETTLLAFANAIYGGVWGTLNPLLAGIWWAGVGGFLWRERRTLGWVTIILAVFALLRDVKIGPIELIGLSVYFVLAPIWAAWLGVDLLRKLEKR